MLPHTLAPLPTGLDHIDAVHSYCCMCTPSSVVSRLCYELLDSLSYGASMGTFTYSGSQTRSFPLKPKVLIVGTQKDQLDEATGN